MSFNKTKYNQKVHRERAQPSSRQQLGLLEKKKDYKLRAEDHQKKQRTLKVLKRKALDKNPDEFYFKMVRTKLEDGEHQTEDTTPTYTEEQLKLMQSQDINYITYKASTEAKKIERLKSSLHLLDAHEKPKNKHIVFVDSKKEAKSFDPAKYLDTHPALLGRTYNRPRMETLQQGSSRQALDDETLAVLATEREKKYKELGKRLEREKQLRIMSQKMAVKKHLMDKKAKKSKVKDETVASAAQYRWNPCRKR